MIRKGQYAWMSVSVLTGYVRLGRLKRDVAPAGDFVLGPVKVRIDWLRVTLDDYATKAMGDGPVKFIDVERPGFDAKTSTNLRHE